MGADTPVAKTPADVALLHWYSFSFFFSVKGGGSGYASVYQGFPDALVTIPRIERAKKSADIPDGATAVLLAATYMGLMTLEEVAKSD